MLGDFLIQHPCKACGEADIRLLDFHHVEDGCKHQEVGDMVRKFYKLQSIILEIAKCEVLCKNCHTLKTYENMPHDWRTKYLESIDEQPKNS